jgi:hypothetical protein
VKVVHAAGNRPNSMKIVPIFATIQHDNKQETHSIKSLLVHTGQPDDRVVSCSFFENLKFPRPDLNFEVGSGSQWDLNLSWLLRRKLFRSPSGTPRCENAFRNASDQRFLPSSRPLLKRLSSFSCGLGERMAHR